MKRPLFLLLLLLSLGAAFPLAAQENKELLARQYFGEQDYDKAAELYEKLAGSDPASLYLYDQYLQCLMALNRWEEADKWVRKRNRRFPDNWHYRVDIGYLLGKQGKEPEAQAWYEGLQREASRGSAAQAEQLAGAFYRRNLFSASATAYEMARAKTGDPRAFSSLLSELYILTGQREKALDEQIAMLETGELGVEETKAELAIWIDESDYPLLRDLLLRRSQRNPDNPANYDLLIWTLVQMREWNAALAQAKAMDRRTRSQGDYLFSLAGTLSENGEYQAAAESYEQIVNTWPGGAYYEQARHSRLVNRYKALEKAPETTLEAWQALAAEFRSDLAQLGHSQHGTQSMQLLSSLYIRKLHEPLQAVEFLRTAVNAAAYSAKDRSLLKLELADAWLAAGDVWESDLLYGQVDREFKEDPLGQEARFRRARLAYFRGEFEWAQTQLEVLKGATTQLISNNAIRLSLLIQDNIGIDSNEHAMSLFSQAELLMMQGRWQDASIHLDSLDSLYKTSTLRDEVAFARARMLEEQGRWEEAAAAYDKVATVYSYDILADNALYRLGLIALEKLGDEKRAMKAFETLILQHTGSLFVVDARKHYRKLRGDTPGEPAF
jgi:tetratricopeptide (TPR) repeat protein